MKNNIRNTDYRSNWKHSELLPLYTDKQFIYFLKNDSLNYKHLFLFSETQEELEVMLIKS